MLMKKMNLFDKLMKIWITNCYKEIGERRTNNNISIFLYRQYP